jgi:transposase-like protein
MTNQFVPADAFCPNRRCKAHGKVSEGNIIKFGRTTTGVQHYQCKLCRGTFTATRGTLFYWRRTPRKEILETLALLAEGVRMSSIVRAKGIKADTILAWLREAAFHSRRVEEVLLCEYRLSRAQIDGLRAYVGTKGEKGAMGKASGRASSGVAR